MKRIKYLIAALIVAISTTHAQSLLTQQPETSEQKAARELLVAPREMRDVVIAHLDDSVERLWQHKNPQGVLDAMGTRAASLFAINEDFIALIAQFLNDNGDDEGLLKLQSVTAKIKPHTISQSGSVTINPEPTPAPESAP